MNHSIPLSQAVAMTTLYRTNKNNIIATGYDTNILPLAETLDAPPLASLLSTPGCVSVRIYYGMSENLYLHAILVAVDENGADILPNAEGNNGADILEETKRCPPYCGPSSPLNP